MKVQIQITQSALKDGRKRVLGGGKYDYEMPLTGIEEVPVCYQQGTPYMSLGVLVAPDGSQVTIPHHGTLEISAVSESA